MPHAPQLFGSLLKSTQVPPHWPPGQSDTQSPFSQE
jgi:hypothetical protein